MAGDLRAKVVISVDLELPAPTGSLAQQRQLDSLTRQLLKSLEQSHTPATIAVADPIHSAATELVLASSVTHEIGVLGDATWLGPTATRERFARELERRVGAAQAAGLPVRSLLLRDVQLTQDFDLVSRLRLTGVRTRSTRHGLAQPEPLRLGIWELPVSVQLPHCGSWWSGGARGAVRRAIKKAACAGGVVHLAIDAGQFAERETLNTREVEQVLEDVANLQAAGKLTLHTMADLTDQLGARRELAPMHSILRPAA